MTIFGTVELLASCFPTWVILVMGHGHTWYWCGHGSCWPVWGLGKSWWPEPPGSKESEMTAKVDSFFPRPSTCAHLNLFHAQINTSLEILGHLQLPVWVQMLRGEWRHLILLELDLGPGRGRVYFGKGQTFTHLNSFASKISVRGWPQAFHISYPLSCQTDCKCPQGHLWLFLCLWQSQPPQEVQMSSQKPLGLTDCSRSFLACVT